MIFCEVTYNKMTIIKPEIIIVDDEEAIRKLARAVLERDESFKNFKFKEFADGAQGHAYFNNGFNPTNLAALISDYTMPVMNGIELIDYACDEKSVPENSCILISGNACFPEFTERRKGVLCLRKPFDLREFREGVKKSVSASGY